MVSYEGIHFDAWWLRDCAAIKEELDLKNVRPSHSQPLTVLAVDAPVMRGCDTYTKSALHSLINTKCSLSVFHRGALGYSLRSL